MKLLYSIPYIIVASLLFVLYLNEKGRCRFLSRRKAVKVAWIFFFVFVGCRGHIYSDFISYYPFYERLPNIFHLNKNTFLENIVEPGFIIYSSLVKTISSNYFVWVAINTFFDYCVFFFFFKKYTSSRILPLIFFMAFQGLFFEFNLFRNVKALDLFLLSIPFLQQRKIIPYMLLNLLGVTFHTSSLIYIPLYFVLHIQMPVVVIWGMVIVANILYFCHFEFIANLINRLDFIDNIAAYDKLVAYHNRDIEVGFSLGYFERLCTMLIFCITYPQLISQKKENIIFINCFLIYYITFLLLYEVDVFVDRVPLLFSFSYWILYPNVISLKNKNRQIFISLATLFVILKIIMSNSNAGARYENVIWDDVNYETRKEIEMKILDT